MTKKTKDAKKTKTPRKTNWFDDKAVLREFCRTEGCEAGDCSIEADAGLTQLHEGTYYTITCGNREYQIARDQDSVRGLAIAIVTQDLNDEPEIFNQGWLGEHIDMAALKSALESDLQDNNRDYASGLGAGRFWEETEGNGLDIPDDVQSALDAGDDPREPTGAELDAFAENLTSDRLRDPMEYLEEIYGDNAVKEAIRIAGIDTDEAAEDAVDTDGPEHFVARYDGKSHETKSQFVYWRTS